MSLGFDSSAETSIPKRIPFPNPNILLIISGYFSSFMNIKLDGKFLGIVSGSRLRICTSAEGSATNHWLFFFYFTAVCPLEFSSSMWSK